MDETDLMGRKRVRVAESQQPETSLLSIDFKFHMEDDEAPMAEAMGSCITVRRIRGAGTPGEMGVESILVKMPGFKRKRQNADGTRLGGLEWDNSVLLNAVHSCPRLLERGWIGRSLIPEQTSFGGLCKGPTS